MSPLSHPTSRSAPSNFESLFQDEIGASPIRNVKGAIIKVSVTCMKLHMTGSGLTEMGNREVCVLTSHQQDDAPRHGDAGLA